MSKRKSQLPRSEEDRHTRSIFHDGKPFGIDSPDADVLIARSQDALRARKAMELGEYTGVLPEYIPSEIGFEAVDTSAFENQSMVRITEQTQKNGNLRGTPNDPALGIINRFDVRCQTCGGDVDTCFGHYGYIPLDEIAYHLNPFFVPHTMMVLNSICQVCSRILISEKDIKDNRLDQITDKFERLRAIENLASKLPCRRKPGEKIMPKTKDKLSLAIAERVRQEKCSMNKNIDPGSYKKYGDLYYKISDKETELLPVSVIRDIFSKLPRQDLRLLGYDDDNRGPLNYIQENILVLPPAIRKETLHETNKNMDKLEQIYNAIIVEKKKLTDPNLAAEAARKIRAEAAKIVTNDKHLTFFERGNREFASIASIFAKKEGTFRGFAGAKRTNFTARTVVTPAGTALNSDQIGLPKVFRTKLTPEVKVNRYNISWLRKLILQRLAENIIVGRPKIYQHDTEERSIPSGEYLAIKKYNYRELADSLAYGDKVLRYVMDGDYVLINRNPTIKKEGIMAAEVKILPDQEKVIRLFLPNTTPFNADHDGDEMNIHLAQNVMAEAEMRNLMNVSSCLVGAQSNRNEIVLSYTAPHSLNDLLKITQLSASEFSNHGMLAIELFPKKWGEYENFKKRLRMHNVPLKSGRAVFSFPFPKNFSYQKVVTSGIYLPESITGPQANNLIHQVVMYLDKELGYTSDDAKTYALNMISYYQQYIDRSFSLVRSVGYKDCFVDDDRINTLTRTAINLARGRISNLNLSTTDPLEKELNLQRIIVTLSNTKSIGTKISKEILDDRNNLVSFLETKSKGHTANLVQMISGVFDIFVRGSIQKKNLFGNRPGPHFDFNDESLEAMGFAEQSYSRGLPFEQIFFTISGALEGLIDSSTKTADTGDLARHLNVMMTGYKTEWNHMAMGANGEILQFFAGGDGLDPRKLSVEQVKGKSTPYPVNVKNLVNNLQTRRQSYRIEDKNAAIMERILRFKK